MSPRRGRHLLQRLAPRAVADDGDDEPLPATSAAPRRRRAHRGSATGRRCPECISDEPVGQAVRARERVVLGPRRDGLAVGPVVDHVHARSGRRPSPRPGAASCGRRARRSASASRSRCRLMRSSARLTVVVVKVLEQRRHLRKDVLAQEHEPRAGAARGPQRGEADDRRIGQRHHDVLAAEPPAGRHTPTRNRSGSCVARPANRLRAKRRAVGAEDAARRARFSPS